MTNERHLTQYDFPQKCENEDENNQTHLKPVKCSLQDLRFPLILRNNSYDFITANNRTLIWHFKGPHSSTM